MRGHGPLLAERMQGRAPNYVFVNDYPCKTDWCDFSEQVTLCTHGDPLSSLDLRCLVGLSVSISSPDLARAQALFAMAVEAGAKSVAAAHVQADQATFNQSGWSRIHTKEPAHG